MNTKKPSVRRKPSTISAAPEAQTVPNPHEAEIARWEILSMARDSRNGGEEHLLDRQLITARDARSGEVHRFTLPGTCTHAVLEALCRDPKKIPTKIRRLADTPDQALTKWRVSVGRGYVRG